MKININRKPISSHEISPMQDFSQVLKGYGAVVKPFYKTKWFGGTVATVVVATAVTAYLLMGNGAGPHEGERGHSPFIQPAIEGVNIEFATYKVNSGVADTVETETGARIIIPPCPFTDENGKEISGEVELKYREFRDPVDFAISGIPMTYDSAGQQYVFESAGMFELQGYQNGKAIAVTKGCPLKVEMKQTNIDGKFNAYYLDTVNKNWEYKGKPEWVVDSQTPAAPQSDSCTDCPPADELVYETNNRVVKNGSTQAPTTTDSKKTAEIQKLDKEIEQLKREKPAEPRKADKTRPRFTLDFDTKDFPELETYTDVLFEVSKEDKTFTTEFYKVDWDKLSLKELEPGVKYKLVMELYARNSPTKKDRVESIIVMPVFDGKNYDEAMKTYKAKYKDYEKKLAAKEAEKKRKEEELRLAQLEMQKKQEEQRKEWEKQQKEWERQQKEWEEQQKVMKEKMEKDAKKIDKAQRDWAYEQQNSAKNLRTDYGSIRNSFNVDRFGIYNTDYPFIQTQASNILLSFTANGKDQHIDILYQLVLDKNALMSNYYYKCCNNRYSFLPENRTILFAVLPGGKLGYYSEADCKKLPTSGEFEVPLTVSDKKFETVREIKAFLGVGAAQ